MPRGDPLADTQLRLDRLNGHAHSADSEHPKLFRLYTLDEFVQRPIVSSQVRGVIPAQSIVVVFGPPKGGKTFSVCDLTMHAAHGLDWHGCAIPRRLKVAYLAGEGVRGLKTRLKAWIEHHDTIENPGDFRILPESLSLPSEASVLIDSLIDYAPDIVVADTLNTYFGGGDENSTKDMSAFCTAVRQLRDALRCSVIIIHHTGHGDSGRERGSIVLRASADVLVHVARDTNDANLVGFQVITARDMESMEAAIPLKLVRHETEWLDEDGEPQVSCVVQAAHQPVTLPGRESRSLGKVQIVMLKAAQELAKGKKPEPSGEVFLVRSEVAALAKLRNGGDLGKSSISMTWQSIENAGFWRRVEPGSIAIRVPS